MKHRVSGFATCITTIAVVLTAGVSAIAAADDAVRFARQYGSAMVLQHGAEGATVWGYAPPGDTITVTVKKEVSEVALKAVKTMVRHL